MSDTQIPAVDAAPVPGWAQRINASLSAGQRADYDDLEEGLAELLQANEVQQKKTKALLEDLDVLTSFFGEVQPLISQMAVARHFNDMPGVLAVLDEFMEKRVVIKEVPAAAGLNMTGG